MLVRFGAPITFVSSFEYSVFYPPHLISFYNEFETSNNYVINFIV